MESRLHKNDYSWNQECLRLRLESVLISDSKDLEEFQIPIPIVIGSNNEKVIVGIRIPEKQESSEQIRLRPNSTKNN